MIKKCKRCGKEFKSLTGLDSYGPECAKLGDNKAFSSLFDLLDDGKLEWYDPIVGEKTRLDKEIGAIIARKEIQELKKYLGTGASREQSVLLLRYCLEIFRQPESDDIPEKFKNVLTHLLNDDLIKDYKRVIITTLLSELWLYLNKSRVDEIYNPENLWVRITYRTSNEWLEVYKRKDLMEHINGTRNEELFNLYIEKLKKGDF